MNSEISHNKLQLFISLPKHTGLKL